MTTTTAPATRSRHEPASGYCDEALTHLVATQPVAGSEACALWARIKQSKVLGPPLGLLLMV